QYIVQSRVCPIYTREKSVISISRVDNSPAIHQLALFHHLFNNPMDLFPPLCTTDVVSICGSIHMLKSPATIKYPFPKSINLLITPFKNISGFLLGQYMFASVHSMSCSLPFKNKNLPSRVCLSIFQFKPNVFYKSYSHALRSLNWGICIIPCRVLPRVQLNIIFFFLTLDVFPAKRQLRPLYVVILYIV
ncbi:unnamed protein product, partial [Staurois parvus]